MTTSIWAENLKLNFRSQSKDGADAKVKTERITWKPEKTAIIVCDMWDDHWCKSASRRVGEMAPALNAMLKALKQ